MSREDTKDCDWSLTPEPDGKSYTIPRTQAAVLMDIRDELQSLNKLLGCYNCVDIPNILRRIDKNTKKPKRKKK